MFDTSVINVVIGLIFIYLLYSLLVTTIQETISTIFNRRANTLYDGIKSMLSNTNPTYGVVINFLRYIFIGISEDFWVLLNKLFTGKTPNTLYTKFYQHPIIKNYGQNLIFKKPSYLTAENFSTILIEILKNLSTGNLESVATFAMIKGVVDDNTTPIDKETRSILQHHLNEAAGDLNVFKYRVEKWFNDTMDRVSGWYKRNTQFYLLLLGFILAVLLNIDSVQITNYLSDNKAAREQLADMGQAAAGNQKFSGGDSIIAKEALDSIKANINKVNVLIGLGWSDYGSSDTQYKRYFLNKKSTVEFNKAYKQNAYKADSIFSDTYDTICTKLLKDTNLNEVYINKISDSLIKNKNLILSQIQFSLLYKNDDFKNKLKRNYIWYRTWHWKKFIGFLITAFAISLGAPFWFDLLNKFISLRTSVKTVDSSGSTTKNNSSDNNNVDG